MDFFKKKLFEINIEFFKLLSRERRIENKKRLHRNFNALFSHKDKTQSPKKDSIIKPNSKPNFLKK
jgi:hypothetical protein